MCYCFYRYIFYHVFMLSFRFLCFKVVCFLQNAVVFTYSTFVCIPTTYLHLGIDWKVIIIPVRYLIMRLLIFSMGNVHQFERPRAIETISIEDLFLRMSFLCSCFVIHIHLHSCSANLMRLSCVIESNIITTLYHMDMTWGEKQKNTIIFLYTYFMDIVIFREFLVIYKYK